ncbi:OLC1v1029310C1 [Oldenlandia corymbosa var. corymbosa]|uniref:OLC1v1029310C1 n=1 Tax=Oldenlandia corymbosa var. corymbosa TaxID=529605 RepID=A0AAV1CDP6_OLDCO|nr:OLC1v1029310C1 [Oldenlandia corymbosa var. corymbosa]
MDGGHHGSYYSPYNHNDPPASNSGTPPEDSGASARVYGVSNPSEFQVSEFFGLDDWMDVDPCTLMMGSQSVGFAHQTTWPLRDEMAGTNNIQQHENTDTRETGDSGGSTTTGASGKGKKVVREKIAFKTKSDIEILDDGFKWRKYGKKMVKNSPNPRYTFSLFIDQVQNSFI